MRLHFGSFAALLLLFAARSAAGADAATAAHVVFSTNNGSSWQSWSMDHHGTVDYDSNDRWRKNMGPFSEGTTVRYAIEVIGTNTTLWIKDDSADFYVTVSNAAAGVAWIGNTRTYPDYGSVDPNTAFWVDTETWPLDVAASATLGYSTNDGASWSETAMSTNGQSNGNDAWHVQLPGFAAGTTVRYYIRAENENGAAFWDNNTGSDYRLRINSLIRDVYTDKGRLFPGHTANIRVDLYNTESEVSGVVTVCVKQLTTEVASFTTNVTLPQWSGKTLTFPWVTPADDFRGYGIDVDLVVSGQVSDTRSSAIDVSSDWTKFPRYGFFSDFYEGDNAEEKARELAKFHISAVQFYDWMSTHDELVPYSGIQPANIFTQVDGRVQSFSTVTAKVAACKSRYMFTMAYSLMYGDSGNNDAPEHITWCAFTEPWSTTSDKANYHDAGYKIWRQDVTNPDWKNHIFWQFRDAMDKAGFEGIHLDNLGGVWNYKYNSDQGIEEWWGFPQFINDARADIRSVDPDARIAHNDVAENYLDDIASSDADIYYTEVWGRDTYGGLRDGILRAKGAGGGKQVVLAAYINRKSWDVISDPTATKQPTYINDASAKLLDACIFANGGFHIELGEDGEMLVNEYFPHRSPRMHPGLERSMRDYYDFAVRYENFLAFNTLGNITDGTDGMNISSTSHSLSKYGTGGTIWTVAKLWRDEYDAVSLINLSGVDDRWREPCSNPTPQTDIQLKYYVDKKVQRVLVATPDDGLGRPVELSFTEGTDGGGYYVTFTVPSLAVWDLVIIDKTTDIKVDGWPGDWVGTAPTNIHEVAVSGGEWIYKGDSNDYRTFSVASQDEDITEVRFTCDNTYLYGLVRMQNITNAALPALGIAWNSYLSPESNRFAWIGDASTPSASIGLENGDQYATRQIMIYTAGGTAKIKLWNGTIWYDPPAADAAVSISTADDVIEFRINKNDLDLLYPQKVAVSLASFRGSGNDAGSDATYDTPDNNNDAIDLLGGDPGTSENAWGRDLDDNSIERYYEMILNEQGAFESIQIAYPFADGQEVDLGPAGMYTITTRFPETLPAVTSSFTLKIGGIEQNADDFYFHDAVSDDFMDEMRFDWRETASDDFLIEIWYDGAGRHLYASRSCHLNKDSDGDFIPDYLEDVNRNKLVESFETSATNTDTDADGLADGFEDGDRNGRIAGDSNSNLLYDVGELWTETDPRTADTDGDRLSDGWEVEQGFIPWEDGIIGHTNMNTGSVITSAEHGAQGDVDEDGMNNFAEMVAGTSARNASSLFKVTDTTVSADGSDWILTWSSVSGRIYRVFSATNLHDPFQPLSGDLPGSTNGFNTYHDPNATTLTTRFYRIHVATP
jgi:dextranase